MIATPVKATRRMDKTPLNPDGRALRRMERDATERIYTALHKWGRSLFRGVTADTVALITARLDDHEHSKPLRDALIAVLQDVAGAGAEFGQKQVERVFMGVKAVDPPGVVLGGVDWTAANSDAAQWAIEYGYSLIRGITDTTRAQVAREVRYFIDNSLTINQLRDRLMAGHLFSRSRAGAIAVTEVTRAYAEGNTAAWKASKVVQGKEWMTAYDEAACPLCRPLSGKIVKLNEAFDGRIMNPPAHPRCRCWVVPVVIDDTAVLSEVGVGPWGAIPIAQAARPVAPVFQTVKEAEQWARNVLGIDADYSEFTAEQANEINKGYARVQSIYDGPAAKTGIRAGSSETRLWVGHAGGSDIQFNPTYLNRQTVVDDVADDLRNKQARLYRLREQADSYREIDPEFAAKLDGKIALLQRQIDTRVRWSVAKSVDDVVIHEIGHKVQADLVNGYFPDIYDFIPPSKLREMGKEYETTLQAVLDGVAKRDGVAISEYATTNAEEYFAEAFTLFVRGEHGAINPTLLSIFKRITR